MGVRKRYPGRFNGKLRFGYMEHGVHLVATIGERTHATRATTTFTAFDILVLYFVF